jgi:hypothetical protein
MWLFEEDLSGDGEPFNQLGGCVGIEGFKRDLDTVRMVEKAVSRLTLPNGSSKVLSQANRIDVSRCE